MQGHSEDSKAAETLEGALFLLALAILVVGTLGGIGLAGIAGVGCSP